MSFNGVPQLPCMIRSEALWARSKSVAMTKSSRRTFSWFRTDGVHHTEYHCIYVVISLSFVSVLAYLCYSFIIVVHHLSDRAVLSLYIPRQSPTSVISTILPYNNFSTASSSSNNSTTSQFSESSSSSPKP
ncbi:hypothetical protein BDW59DRAFT_51095 [Aspergillus cavernicola]|uniref:Uncharacterized protein n=1 Tax=Aspergillus cavernicola TaxID=176166 RepID=A0ABR4IKB1_9EURO